MSKGHNQIKGRKKSNNISADRKSQNRPHSTASAMSPVSLTSSNGSKPREELNNSPKKLFAPWIIAIAGVISLSSIVLPDSWALSWTEDPSPNWAQPTVLLVGLIAMIPFLHALAATQGLAAAKGSSIEDQKLWRTVCEKALLYVAAGIFSGTLYALFTLDGAPSRVKVTSVIADIATIGGILGLTACIPYNIKMTKVALARLRNVKKKLWNSIIQGICVMDFLIVSKLLFLLPFVLHNFA